MKVYVVVLDVFYQEGTPEKVFTTKELAEIYIADKRKHISLSLEDYSIYEMEVENTI